MKGTPWFKPRGYTHFSKKISFNRAGFVHAYVRNPVNIARHKFYPLIYRSIAEKKYKKQKRTDGTTFRSHHIINQSGKKISTVKFRQIFYCNHLDAQIYSYYANHILSPLYEQHLKELDGLDQAIIGYRRIPIRDEDRCKSNIEFANEVFELIGTSTGRVSAIAFDISKFFDSLDHKILKQQWSRLLGGKCLAEDHFAIFKSLTKFSYVELKEVIPLLGLKHVNELRQKEIEQITGDGEAFRSIIKHNGLIRKNPFRREKGGKDVVGIPQGTPISALLANIYMLEFDFKMVHFANAHHATYRRYSDDILFIVPTEFENTFKEYVEKEIAELKINIQPSKTQTTRFINGSLTPGEKPIQYLGFEFDGKHKRLKSSSISKYYRNLKRYIQFKAISVKKVKRKDDEGGFIYRKPIYKAYSHLGAVRGTNRKRNYLSYAYRASDVMKSKAIRRQMANSWKIMEQEIDKQTRKKKLHTNQDKLNYYLTARPHESDIAISAQ